MWNETLFILPSHCKCYVGSMFCKAETISYPVRHSSYFAGGLLFSHVPFMEDAILSGWFNLCGQYLLYIVIHGPVHRCTWVPYPQGCGTALLICRMDFLTSWREELKRRSLVAAYRIFATEESVFNFKFKLIPIIDCLQSCIL